jgi:hypothetical protein
VSASARQAKVFATGESAGTTTGPDYATIGYTAATGARLSLPRYKRPRQQHRRRRFDGRQPGRQDGVRRRRSTGVTSG